MEGERENGHNKKISDRKTTDGRSELKTTLNKWGGNILKRNKGIKILTEKKRC